MQYCMFIVPPHIRHNVVRMRNNSREQYAKKMMPRRPVFQGLLDKEKERIVEDRGNSRCRRVCESVLGSGQVSCFKTMQKPEMVFDLLSSG